MAVACRRVRVEPPLRQWRDRETRPWRTAVWKKAPKPRKAPVVYCLISRNGQSQHPHPMEVALCSGDGLYLSQRRYEYGFVWHDLSEDDLVLLMGSELLQPHLLPELSRRHCLLFRLREAAGDPHLNEH